MMLVTKWDGLLAWNINARRVGRPVNLFESPSTGGNGQQSAGNSRSRNRVTFAMENLAHAFTFFKFKPKACRVAPTRWKKSPA
jgi:hypothetical protein